jgi:hypothetical protein
MRSWAHLWEKMFRMKGIHWGLCFAILICTIYAKAQNAPLQAAPLQAALDSMEVIESAKRHELNRIWAQTAAQSGAALYDICEEGFHAYIAYQYDTAHIFAQWQLDLATQLHDDDKLIRAQLNVSFALLSGGLFHEALGRLHALQQYESRFTKEQRLAYYHQYFRLYADWAEYANKPPYEAQYQKQANFYLDLALQQASYNSFDSVLLHTIYFLRQQQPWQNGAGEVFAFPADKSKLLALASTPRQKAMLYSCLAALSPSPQEQLQYLELSCLYELRGAVRETTSFMRLATLYYQQGDVARAYQLIQYSYRFAEFYGSSHRKYQQQIIQPIIEGKKLLEVEQQKQTIGFYLQLLMAFGALVLVLLGTALALISKLKKKRNDLANANQQLQALNARLREADQLKEEYIGYYFNLGTDYVNKIRDLKKELLFLFHKEDKKALLQLLQSFQPKEERKAFLQNFDQMFLKLFPDFVEQFNLLFAPEDRMALDQEQCMPTEMRIFALMRLGVSSNEKVAEILDLSINTIYSYKTRVKKKALVPADDFMAHLGKIKSVGR